MANKYDPILGEYRQDDASIASPSAVYLKLDCSNSPLAPSGANDGLTIDDNRTITGYDRGLVVDADVVLDTNTDTYGSLFLDTNIDATSTAGNILFGAGINTSLGSSAANLNIPLDELIGLVVGVNGFGNAQVPLIKALEVTPIVGGHLSGNVNFSTLMGLRISPTVNNGDISGTTTLTNYYGIYLDGKTGAGTLTNEYGVYQAGANAINHFAGNISVGTYTVPARLLHLKRTGDCGFRLERTSGVTFDFNTDTTAVHLNMISNAPMKFYTANTLRFSLLNDGSHEWIIGKAHYVRQTMGSNTNGDWRWAYTTGVASLGQRQGGSFSTYFSADSNGTFSTWNGRIKNTTRVTTDYTLLVTDEVVYVDTDGGEVEITYPAGVKGTHYKIINCGSSGNDVILTPYGTEKINGDATQTLYDGDIWDGEYNATEGWWG